jgi:hypothetical protein
VGIAASLCSNGVRRGRESTVTGMTMRLDLLEFPLTHGEGLILAVTAKPWGFR